MDPSAATAVDPKEDSPQRQAATEPVPHALPKPSAGDGKSKNPTLERRHSTSNVGTEEVNIYDPDKRELIDCMATQILRMINAPLPPLQPGQPPRYAGAALYKEFVDKDNKVPDHTDVRRLIRNFAALGDVAPQALIMALAYIDRIQTQLPLTSDNWKRLVFANLLLACKVWEDEAIWNTDFKRIFPDLTGKILYKIERQLLAMLKYSVTLKSSQYAEYYFQLRTLSANQFSEYDLTEAHRKRLKEQSLKISQLARAGKPIFSVQLDADGRVINPRPDAAAGPKANP